MTRRNMAAACAAGYISSLLILLWARVLDPSYLAAAAVAVGVTVLWIIGGWIRRRRAVRSQVTDVGAPVERAGAALADARAIQGDDGLGERSHRGRVLVLLAGGALILAMSAGLIIQNQLRRIDAGWPELSAQHEARLGAELGRAMDRLLERSRRAADEVAVRVESVEPAELFSELATVRTRTGVAALAVVDQSGELVAWAGDHRGALPVAVRLGEREVHYAERPLFGYLYVVRPVEDRDVRVVAASLLQTGLVLEGQGMDGVADRFAEEFGSRPHFMAGPGPGGAWSLVAEGRTVVHARFDPTARTELRMQFGQLGRRVAVPLMAVALLLLTAAWLRVFRGTGFATAAPLLGLAVALATMPIDGVIGTDRPFSPALYLLPIPGEPSLGRLLAVLLPLAALTAVARQTYLGPRASRVVTWAGMAAVAVGFTGGLRLLLSGAAPSLLEGGVVYWGGVQVAALLVLTMIAALALPQGRPGRIRPLALTGGAVVSLALAGLVLLHWRLTREVSPWLPILWAAPFGLLATGILSYAGRGRQVVRWLVAGWLAASVVLPHFWVTQVDAKLRAADRELSTLGPRPDPFLDYLLNRFADEAMRRDVRGEDGVELLYRTWVASGLAREAYPARIRLWRPNDWQRLELAVGDPASVQLARRITDRRLNAEVVRARGLGGPIHEPAFREGGGQILTVPLQGGRAVTVVVPPRRSLDRTTFLAPIFGAQPKPDTRLTLVPVTRLDGVESGPTHWVRTDQGWRSEKPLRYPDGTYHAHLELRLPSLGIVLARGALLLALDLILLSLLWVVGSTGRGRPPSPPGGWVAWLGTFRARVTLALFAFFLLPTVVFGLAAYRALAGEAARTARVVAERAAAQAAEAFNELPGEWPAISDRIGEEVLYYHRGELARASSPEVVELGLFGAWMPPSVYATLQSGEELSVVETRTLARRPYIVAYRRLPAGTLAVPVSLATGEASLRQRELADLILFAVLLGGLLSLSLSVLVGRALSRPIGQLRRASAAVGRGRLRVNLPETGAGEFGEVFASFNRMVRRLRDARAREVHTARVLAWGEMSRQVAHEIKNPLTPIKLSVQHLRRAYRDGRQDFGEILDTNVEQILTEIDRLTEIARAFSRYGAPPEAAGPVVPVDAEASIREALTLYRTADAGVAYRAEVEEGLPPVMARGGELKEVLLNLLENAHVALDGIGTVTVSARRDGDEVEIIVADDGPGMAPELLPRIFEPHFSTRSAGTGLGLAIVKRLVESWGGALDAESELGQGTAIHIRLSAAKVPTAASGN